MHNQILVERLVILGVGLIGGSLARAIKTAGVCREIVGWGRTAKTPGRALNLGVIDRAETDLAAAIHGADILVVAVPPGAMAALFLEMAPLIEPQTIITDVGSTKESVVAAARAAFVTLPPYFVPGHPIAGNEHSGVDASDAELFKNRRVILTPVPETAHQALHKVRLLWEICGATVTEMSVEHHDAILAATSHLPHLLAYALVETLTRLDDSWEIFRYAAGGFRDFTRIASSDPVMWRDICLANPKQILAVLEQYQTELTQLAAAIKSGDGEYLYQAFKHARAARKDFLARNYSN